jgi:hypothetical protein
MTTRRKLLALVVVAVVVAAASGSYTWSALVATDDNDANQIGSGTVTPSDNDSGNALLALSSALPGASDTGCIKVSYAGSLPANVRLYGTTGGSGLDQYLTLQITRGTYSGSEPAFDSCTNFQADATNYIGAGAGVIYSGTLQGYPDSYAAGLVDPVAGSPEVWNGPEFHVYRIQVTLQNVQAAEGLNATQAFTWEARNQ